MFYLQSSLSRKGHLGNIFLAAYFFKKLNKEQILRTDIISSVDKIILDVDIPYRVVSPLLLGVVRIFMKKVEILYHDSTNAMNRICKAITPRVKRMRPKEITTPHSSHKQRRFSHVEEEEESGKTNGITEEAMVAPYLRHVTITIPKNLTLDSFKFDVPEESNEEGDTYDNHCLIDGDKEEYGRQLSSGKLLQYQNTEDQIFGFNSTFFTPIKDVLSGEMMTDEFIDLQMDDSFISGIEPLKEVQHRHESSNSLNVKQSLIVRLDAVEHDEVSQHVVQSINLLRGDWNVEDFGKSVSEKFSKGGDPDGTHHQIKSIQTPQVSSESLEFRVKSPAIKEGKRAHMFSRKRKCVLDNATILSNSVMKESIEDSSSMVLKRRRAIHTSLDVWRTVKFCNLHKAFTEPLIPYPYPEFKDRTMKKYVAIKEDCECEILPEDIGSADDDHLKGFATHDNYLGQEDRVEKDDDLVGTSSTFIEADIEETTKTSTCPPEEEEEGPESQCGFSIRTRSVARYLCKVVKEQSKKDDRSNSVNLCNILDGKIRKSSANVFYETLVLKSQGYIDVRQEAPYSEIVMFYSHLMWHLIKDFLLLLMSYRMCWSLPILVQSSLSLCVMVVNLVMPGDHHLGSLL